ncbi:hypothetical protein TIFTF001_029485 [Ficus carica]|uniref:Uncharacterized protein n=1 Tax=Ficus carica TaxID=3494 RepID=A0AA88DRP6_FICCA|nr:hypothetical protein TIFTF001_029485 [Ficus carica]
MEVEISIRLNRIPLTRIDPTRRFFPGNHVTRPEFTTSPSLSQHFIHHLTSDVKPITAHINSQLPPPATAHITSPTSATCPDWGYTYWHRRQLTLVSPIPNQGHAASVHWTYSSCAPEAYLPVGSTREPTRTPESARNAYK